MKLGITGHQQLENHNWVKRELMGIIDLHPAPIIGVTSLAVGADQIFARAVLECSGMLQVVVPCKDYIRTFENLERAEYECLLSRASAIEVLPIVSCSQEAYLAAGQRVVNISDLIIAVWNGKPSAGLGGTADVVNYAKSQGKKYFHINPVSRETTQPE